MEFLTNETVKDKLTENFLSPRSMIQHQIHGFDWFVEKGFCKVVRDEPAVCFTNETTRIVVKLLNPRVNRETKIDDVATNDIINVDYCRKTDSTYAFNLEVDIVLTVHKQNTTPMVEMKHSEILMKLPIMIGSYIGEKGKDGDPGGYFVIKGKERVLFSQIRNAYDKMICHFVRGELICEMRSMCEETMHSTKIEIKKMIRKNQSNSVGINLQYFSEVIPVAFVLKAYRQDLVSEGFNFINKCIENDYVCSTREECVDFMMKRLIVSDHAKASERFEQILHFDMFPHLGISVIDQEIINMIMLMVQKFCLVESNVIPVDKKDAFEFKRVESAGELLYTQFKINFKKILISTSKHLSDCFENSFISQVCKFSPYHNSLVQNFSKGEWGSLKNNYTRKGVSQVIFPKSNQIGMISAMRRCVIPENKEGKDGKNIELRQISEDSSFFLCPCETPEGQSIGLVLNFALFAHVSLRVSKIEVMDVMFEHFPLRQGFNQGTLLIVNGRIIGSCIQSVNFMMKKLKEMKIKNMIPNHASIHHDAHMNTVEVCVDAGRLFRPVFHVRNIKESSHFEKIDILLQIPCSDFFNFCMERGWLEYVGIEEIRQSKIIIDSINDDLEDVDYMEMSPVGMLGYIAAQIPFANRTQSSRNCFQSSMMKQAIGSMMDFTSKLEIKSLTLFYPQIPLVSTRTSEYMGVNEFPNGINAIVALCCYSGFNQEDCIILKKSFVDRGAFHSLSKSVVSFAEKRSMEEIVLPPHEMRKRHFRYHLLDDEGIVKEGSFVTDCDVVIGVVDLLHQKDKSVLANESGLVKKVHITKTLTGRVVKVETISAHVPETGDKFLSAMAQKGTCCVMHDHDLPFSENGMIPDIIINPNCIPGRMTINQLLATVMSKGYCFSKKKTTSRFHPMRDATAFQDSAAVNEIIEIMTDKSKEEDLFWFSEMKELGFDLNGTEILHCGQTGIQIKSRIFMGPLYYFALTHKVDGKIHARGHDGPKTAMFRQPAAGRRNGGGMRWGEMETDAVTAYGASNFLHESLTKRSDDCEVFICKRCQCLAMRENYCHVCREGEHVKVIPMTHSSLILIRNIETMGLKMNFNLE